MDNHGTIYIMITLGSGLVYAIMHALTILYMIDWEHYLDVLMISILPALPAFDIPS